MDLVMIQETLGVQQLGVQVQGAYLPTAVHLVLHLPLPEPLDHAVDDAGDMEDEAEDDQQWPNYP